MHFIWGAGGHFMMLSVAQDYLASNGRMVDIKTTKEPHSRQPMSWPVSEPSIL
jgi:hypothetical protein